MAQGLHTKATRRRASGEMKDRSRPKGWIKGILFSLMVVSAVTVAGFTVAPATGASAASSGTDTPPPPCPAGYTCTTIPCSTSNCPVVQAGPTTNISSDPQEYAFVNLYDFPAGDAPEILLCADTTPLAQGAPMCATGNPDDPFFTPIFSDGQGFGSMVVPEVENNGTSAIAGEQLGNDSDKGTFYCDNGPDYCSIVVFDTNLDNSTTPDSENTAVIPVSFAANGSGCSNATLVNTESDFGIEGLIQSADQAGCSETNPALAFNTATDSLQAVSDLASGGMQIAFSDDPQAADEQSALSEPNSDYAFIPVAVSADVIGFSAYISGDPPEGQNTIYPHTTFDLTPNMVAGLVTEQYGTPSGADMLNGTKCTNPLLGGKLQNCPAMEYVNSISGFEPEADYTAYLRSDNAGVTDELLDWLCNAPDHTVSISNKTVSEALTAAQVVEQAHWADTKLDGTCPETDQFPSLTGNDANTFATPGNQSKALYSQVGNGFGTPPKQAGFATMNWYEALYNGLGIASLQNAAGAYVAPTATSVDAALNDATKNADGTLTFNYANTQDQNAYPEPVVFYAVVSTQPQPATQAAGIRNVLNNILSLTASTSTQTLPDGVLPLTSSLTSEAQTDISKDIVSEPPSSTTTTTTVPGSTKTTTPTTSRVTTETTGPDSTGESNPISSSNGSAGSSPATTVGTSKTKTTPSSGGKEPPKTPVKPGLFKAVQVGLAAPEWRWLLVAMLIAGGIAMGVGPFILFAERLRRRMAVSRKDKT